MLAHKKLLEAQCKKRNWHNISGFTLIELVFIMLIIGLIASFVVTSMDGLVPSYKLKGAAGEIAGTIELAQMSAISKNSPLAIRYDIDKNKYWIVLAPEDGIIKDEVDEKEARIGERALPSGIYFLDIVFGENEKHENGYVTQRISPLGAVSSLMIHIENEKKSQMTIEVLAISGQVIYYDFYKEWQKVTPEE